MCIVMLPLVLLEKGVKGAASNLSKWRFLTKLFYFFNLKIIPSVS